MDWLKDCLIHYGLSNKEASKIITSEDKSMLILKDIIFDAYDVINNLEEELGYKQPCYESLSEEQKRNVLNIKNRR